MTLCSSISDTNLLLQS